jgi:transglutaminase-like putative cysteine protease
VKLRVFHRTSYEYAGPVRDSFNEAHLQPLAGGGQLCHGFELRIQPAARVTQYRDFQLNHVHAFDVSDPHSALVVEAISSVTTAEPPALAAEVGTTPLAAMAACARLDSCHDFLQASRYVEADVWAWKLGIDITAGISDAWRAAHAAMRYIHRHFTYAPAATTVHTHMREVLRLRRGVCQDFAHVLIGICRSLKIPTRYVSGYLYNGPADRLRGAQATHAWAEVYIPGRGWLGLDPTNGGQPDGRYVKVAVGRDYGDVSPLRGTYRGTSQRRMTVEVQVNELAAEAAAK